MTLSSPPPSPSFTVEELTRYSRHFSLPNIGIHGQEKLKAARVLCVGAGGLGSSLLLYLVAAGVGHIGVIDEDSVELSNLQRQVLYSITDIGAKKVTIAKKHLLQLNPNVRISDYPTSLTHANALEIIQQYDMVVDGTDNFASRYLINDACFHLKKPNIYASVFQFEGQCAVFNVRNTPCYRCLYPAPPPQGLIPNCSEAGVLGVLPGLMGTLQGIEVLKLILKIGEPLTGKLLTVNALTMQFQTFAIPSHPHCLLCQNNQSFDTLPYHELAGCAASSGTSEITPLALKALQESQTPFILIDVREPYEYAICHLHGQLIPLSQLSQHLNALDKSQRYIVHCKAGSRSEEAAKLMRAAGFVFVQTLKGGIIAWANEIDNTLPTY